MRDSNSFPAPKPKEVYEVQFRVISRRSLDCLLQGPLIKSYITRKPPIAPNSKQLSQPLLPTQPHGGSLRRGLCLGVRGGQLGDRFNIMWGHVLMLLRKCSLWSIRLQSPSYVGVGRGEEGWGVGGHWRNHCNIGGSKNPACQGLWYFFNEETSSHFSPEGWETKAKFQLKLLKTIFKPPNYVCVCFASTLTFFFPLEIWRGRQENILFWGSTDEQPARHIWPCRNVQKYSFGAHKSGECVIFSYQSLSFIHWKRVFYLNLSMQGDGGMAMGVPIAQEESMGLEDKRGRKRSGG